MLFEDDDRAAARTRRASPVERADVSDAAKRKARRKITATGLPFIACAPFSTISPLWLKTR